MSAVNVLTNKLRNPELESLLKQHGLTPCDALKDWSNYRYIVIDFNFAVFCYANNHEKIIDSTELQILLMLYSAGGVEPVNEYLGSQS